MIRVAIVDDHPIVRAGMTAVLAATVDIAVVGQAGTGASVLALVRDCRPDVLVLDVSLPDMDAPTVLAQLLENDRPAILILTLHSDDETIFSLLEKGIQGYLLKDEAVEMLPQAVRAIAEGKNWLSPEIARKVIRRALASPPAPAAHSTAEPASPLTPREQEVLALIAQGLDNATIANRLAITNRTVQNYTSSIYSKLGVTNRTEAALYAIQRGWVAGPQKDGC